MTREEAARVLKDLWVERDEIAKFIQQLTKSSFERQEALRMGVAALRGPQPDPDTGLVPCGCGGEVYPHFQFGWTHEESGVQAFEVSTGCDGCGTYTKSRRGHYVNGIDEVDTESASKRDWNISHGYTALRQGWVRTAERVPEGDEHKDILGLYKGKDYYLYDIVQIGWLRLHPEMYPYWTDLPAKPE